MPAWAKGGNSTYPVRLVVSSVDRRGMLKELTTVIDEIKTNIRDIRSDSHDDGNATIYITVEINDLQHLDRVISAVKGINGVIDVIR